MWLSLRTHWYTVGLSFIGQAICRGLLLFWVLLLHAVGRWCLPIRKGLELMWAEVAPSAFVAHIVSL